MEKTFLIPVQDIASFMRNHVAFSGQPSDLAQFALTRKEVAASKTEKANILAEELQCFNHPILIEYEIPTSSGDTSIPVKMKITANGFPVPGLIAESLWASLSEALAAGYQNSQVSRRLRFLQLGRNGILFANQKSP